MAVETLAAGDAVEIVDIDDVVDRVVKIIDGQRVFLLDTDRGAPETGDLLLPGQAQRLSPKRGRKEVLHAVGADVLYEVIVQEDEVSGGEDQRLLTLDLAGSVTVPVIRVTNTTPGANTNVQIATFDLDLRPPASGAWVVVVQLEATDAAATLIVEQAIDDGDTITSDLNEGTDLVNGSRYEFEVSCRRDSVYNFQLDTAAVEIDLLEINYVPMAVS